MITVLQGLAREFPAAVIVLQHQRPDRPSELAHILGRSCDLPVAEADDEVGLDPGRVVVVPPGKHALVTTGNRLALIASDGPPPYRPSADLLLTSLALVAAPRTVAVVLSGGGNDGAVGAAALHEFGGVVIASDERSSESFGMPAAAIGRDGAVDYVVAVGDIPPLLTALVEAPPR